MDRRAVEGIRQLIDWRDSTRFKRKARAIQFVIDKKWDNLPKLERGMLIHELKLAKKRLSEWWGAGDGTSRLCKISSGNVR